MKFIVPLCALVLLSGCVSGYKQFYTQIPGVTPEAIAATRAAPPPSEPEVQRSAGIPDEEYLGRLGYAAIGYSSFNSGRVESESSAVAQARDVGADLVVIINPQYTNTVNSQIPITTPTSQTSYTAGSATAYGSGGSATAYGSSTTTTYGSKTTYMPMSVRRYDYGAVYYVKKKYSLGVSWREFTSEERQIFKTNAGLYIRYAVKGTPAFYADILPGDILAAINGESIYGVEEAGELLRKHAGEEVDLAIFRDGEIIKKTVKLSE